MIAHEEKIHTPPVASVFPNAVALCVESSDSSGDNASRHLLRYFAPPLPLDGLPIVASGLWGEERFPANAFSFCWTFILFDEQYNR